MLGINPTSNQSVISNAWRRLAQATHPDKGGSTDAFDSARKAYEQALALAPTIIEIKRPAKLLSFKLSLAASEVLDKSVKDIEFYDHLGCVIECTINIPAWQMSWGKEQTLKVPDIDVSDGSAITLIITCTVRNDSLVIEESGLALTPEVLAADAIGKDSIEFFWQGRHKISIDKYGQGLLYSKGYLLEDGSRANILVKPKYVFS